MFGTYTGVIAGAIVDVSGNGIRELYAGQAGNFFYAGTAPSPTTITFTIDSEFNSSHYYTSIANIYTNKNKPYNAITIES